MRREQCHVAMRHVKEHHRGRQTLLGVTLSPKLGPGILKKPSGNRSHMVTTKKVFNRAKTVNTLLTSS